MRHLSTLLALAGLTLATATASYRTPALIELDAPFYEASETATNLTVTLVRSGEFRETTTLDYSLEDGSAEAGSDFAASGGTVTFKPGEGFKVITIPIVLDGESEGVEDFSIVLSNPGYNCVLVQERAVVTIQDAAISPAPARLKVVPGLNETLLISWPVTSADGVLERSISPASGPWEEVPTAPKRMGAEWSVAEPANGPRFFYRLRQQP